MILKVTSRVARWGRLLFLPFFGCSRSHLPDRKPRPNYFAGITVFILLCSGPLQAIELGSDVEIASAGYYQLLWSGKAGTFQLQEARTSEFSTFKVLYQGNDLARVISGKSDGEYFYRITAIDAGTTKQSNVIKVTVAHHPLKNAILFFIAGAIVFIATLILIIKGNKQES